MVRKRQREDSLRITNRSHPSRMQRHYNKHATIQHLHGSGSGGRHKFEELQHLDSAWILYLYSAMSTHVSSADPWWTIPVALPRRSLTSLMHGEGCHRPGRRSGCRLVVHSRRRLAFAAASATRLPSRTSSIIRR